jgi:hypothetical protein
MSNHALSYGAMLARMVIQNGMFPLYESEHGEKYTMTVKVTRR